MAKGAHGLDGLGFPIGDDVAVVFVESEMAADVDVEVVFVAVIAKQGVGVCQNVHIDELFEAVDFGEFVGQPPSLQIEVEFEAVHYELLDALDFLGVAFGVKPPKPRVALHFPNQRRADVGEHQRVEKLGEDEDFHIRKGEAGREFFHFLRGNFAFFCCHFKYLFIVFSISGMSSWVSWQGPLGREMSVPNTGIGKMSWMPSERSR